MSSPQCSLEAQGQSFGNRRAAAAVLASRLTAVTTLKSSGVYILPRAVADFVILLASVGHGPALAIAADFIILLRHALAMTTAASRPTNPQSLKFSSCGMCSDICEGRMLRVEVCQI